MFAAKNFFLAGGVSAVSAVEALIVAGGGGATAITGGGSGGGGGAGGLLYYGAETPKTPNGAAIAVTTGTTYTIEVGSGGAATTNASGVQGN